MRFYEFNTTKPLTPQQARINQLKQQKERASANLEAEKDNQKKRRALANISKNNAALAKLNNF
jgi:hypothetical protein